MKVPLQKCHLNGNTIAFYPQTQKLVPPFNTPSFPLGEKLRAIICICCKKELKGYQYFSPINGRPPKVGVVREYGLRRSQILNIFSEFNQKMFFFSFSFFLFFFLTFCMITLKSIPFAQKCKLRTVFFLPF